MQSDTTPTTDPLQRLQDLALADLEPMALPSERSDIMMWAAAEIERLRTALAIYANPKHWTFRDEGSWDTTFIGPPGPDRDGWEIAAEALK